MQTRVSFAALACAITLWLATPALHAQTSTGTTAFHVSRSLDDPYPVWKGNSLVVIENASSRAPIVHCYDGSGQEIQQATLEILGASLINVYNGFARSADGYLAVSGSAYADNNVGTVFLMLISPVGPQVVIRTSPYAARAVTFAPDGTVWTAGEVVNGPEAKQDYNIIRRFDRNGNLLGGALPRSTLPGGGLHPSSGSYIMASKDRIGWYSRVAGQYIEFSLDGKEIARYPHQISSTAGAALCDDNSVWVGVQAKDNQGRMSWAISSLDRNNATWSEVKQSIPTHLYGCSGTTLVADTGKVGLISWFVAR
jgi:hypothetical protein